MSPSGSDKTGHPVVPVTGAGGVDPLIPRFFKTLLSTQTATQARIRAYQRGLLERLVRHASIQVPFYRDTRRLDPLFRKDGTFDMAGWNAVPVLTRSEALDHCEALRAAGVPSEMLPLHDDCTSGSTGEPLPFRRTQLAGVVSAALLARAIHWHGAIPVTRFGVMKSMSGGGSKPRQDTLGQGAPIVEIDTDADVAGQAAAIRRSGATHILGRANILLAIAEDAGTGSFPGIRLIVQTGEVLRPEARARIETAFGAKVIDSYATSELGPVAIEGTRGRLRMAEENVYLEWPSADVVLTDPHRAIMTPFYAYGTPLIRYAPGDFVRFSNATSPDTPGLRQLTGVIGRERSLFRRPDGTRFSPELSGWRIHEIVRVRRWRLTQTTLSTAVFEFMVDRPLDNGQFTALRDMIAQAIDPITIEVRPVETLVDDRAVGKAFEAYRCLITEDA